MYRPVTSVCDSDPIYIVRLKDPPVAAYAGGIGGYPATAPAATAKTAAGALNKLGKAARNAAKQLWKKRPRLNVRGANVKTFVKFLKQQQKKVAQDVGVAAQKLIHRPNNDILKPDIIAPGVALWAAAPSPTLIDYDSYFRRLSGTSMATPHIAGIAALIIQQKPTWTPAQVMSAITTTASVRNNRGTPIRTQQKGQASPAGDRVATPWEMGSGHAKKEFRSIAVKPIRACNLNRASISVSKLQRSVTVTRRVTNVASEASTYESSVEFPPGVNVVVNPPSFTIQPDQTYDMGR
ncbi:hypothetical protein CLOP_g4729 [Closterium sp. NIES-67]|nr:hypothetical protein CLOP_g4729 [Closterium sp. NIES-67]